MGCPADIDPCAKSIRGFWAKSLSVFLKPHPELRVGGHTMLQRCGSDDGEEHNSPLGHPLPERIEHRADLACKDAQRRAIPS